MQAFVVLVTDFAAVQQVYGPFHSRTSAVRWADENLRDVYRVFPMTSPVESPADVAPAAAGQSQQ